MAIQLKPSAFWFYLTLLPVAAIAAPLGDSLLMSAVKGGDRAAIVALLKAAADVNAAEPDGATALHWAVHKDDAATAELLIGAGADVNAQNEYGVTPLSLACTNGSALVVKTLLEAGADPNATLPTGETVLMTCSRSGSAEGAELLLARGADVNARQPEDGQTALMWAVAQRHPAVAEVLLEHGAELNARSKGGFSPLMFAARVGDAGSARVLLAAGADVNERMPVAANAKAPRDAYASNPAPGEEPTKPPDAQPPLGSMTPLLMASASGHQELAIYLLEQGADPNAIDEHGAVPLHYTVLKGIASMNGVSLANYVSYLFRPNLPELVKALLEHGANPNSQLLKGVPVAGRNGSDAAGATPFVLAAAASDPTIMRQLAEHGADPLLTTADHRTAIMAAAGLGRVQDFTPEEEKDALEAVRLAVELGSDVNAVNEMNRAALHGATNLGANSIIEYLASKGARLDVRDKYQQTPLSIASGVHLPWTPKGDELGEVVRRKTADLLLKLGATPLDTPNYFTPPEEETDVLRMNPRRTVRGTNVPEYGPQ